MAIQRKVRRAALIFIAAAVVNGLHADAQSYSEWIDASGMVQVEYRWKQNDAKGCDLEYRSSEDRGKRRYKIRVVYRNQGEEFHKANAILAFESGANNSEGHVPGCSMVTDITVTGW